MNLQKKTKNLIVIYSTHLLPKKKHNRRQEFKYSVKKKIKNEVCSISSVFVPLTLFRIVFCCQLESPVESPKRNQQRHKEKH